jgi:hypothetical protein
MVTFSLRTDKPTICSVEFGITTSLDTTNVEAALTTDHIIVLTNLEPATDYFVRVRSFDADGNTSVTDIMTVSTPSVTVLVWPAAVGTLVYPMSIGDDALVTFVWSPSNDVGSVSFDVQLPVASQYRVWCHVWTFAADVGSFYLSVDDSAEFIFDAASPEWETGWRWIAVKDATSSIGATSPWVCLLSPDLHRLVFRANEAITFLREVILSNDPDWVPYATASEAPVKKPISRQTRAK